MSWEGALLDAARAGTHSLVIMLRVECEETWSCTALTMALVQHRHRHAYINMLGTSPAFRRNGLCHALMECVVEASPSGLVMAEAHTWGIPSTWLWETGSVGVRGSIY